MTKSDAIKAIVQATKAFEVASTDATRAATFEAICALKARVEAALGLDAAIDINESVERERKLDKIVDAIGERVFRDVVGDGSHVYELSSFSEAYADYVPAERGAQVDDSGHRDSSAAYDDLIP